MSPWRHCLFREPWQSTDSNRWVTSCGWQSMVAIYRWQSTGDNVRVTIYRRQSMDGNRWWQSMVVIYRGHLRASSEDLKYIDSESKRLNSHYKQEVQFQRWKQFVWHLVTSFVEGQTQGLYPRLALIQPNAFSVETSFHQVTCHDKKIVTSPAAHFRNPRWVITPKGPAAHYDFPCLASLLEK